MTIPVDPGDRERARAGLAGDAVGDFVVGAVGVEAEAVISADAPFVTFSDTLLESESVSDGGDTSNSSKSVSVIVKSAVLVLPSSEVEVTVTLQVAAS